MMIDITGVDLEELAKEVYDLSTGPGISPDEIGSEMLEQIIDIYVEDPKIALNMDIVNGRSCKMMVFRKDDRLEIQDMWHEHSTEQLNELLRRCDVRRDLQ